MTPAPTTATFESPSLTGASAAEPAFELKFLLDEAGARQVRDWADRHLALDPHGEAALGGAYRTTSLYCDTPELDVYHRSAGYRRSKYRVRRYGAEPAVFLERKTKKGDRVSKQRTLVPLEEMARLVPPLSLVDWAGHWFHARLRERRLAPACRISYQRMAYVGSCSDGPLRLTLDQGIRGALAGEWCLAPFEGGLPLLVGQVILELKFHAALPGPFKELVWGMNLAPRPVSKYRLCREACGLASPPGTVREA